MSFFYLFNPTMAQQVLHLYSFCFDDSGYVYRVKEKGIEPRVQHVKGKLLFSEKTCFGICFYCTTINSSKKRHRGKMMAHTLRKAIKMLHVSPVIHNYVSCIKNKVSISFPHGCRRIVHDRTVLVLDKLGHVLFITDGDGLYAVA